MTSPSVHSPILASILKAVSTATKHILRDFREIDLLQNSKAGTLNFASKTVSRIEQLLVQELNKARSDAAILGVDKTYISSDSNSRFFIIPLDSFNNFMHAIPFFATGIVYEKKNLQGEFEAQSIVIDVPIQREIYIAEKGNGAWREAFAEANADNSRLRVSQRKIPEEILVCSSSEIKSNDGFIYNKFTTGSVLIDLAYFASGRFDLFTSNNKYLEKFSLIGTEAGGMIKGNENNTLYLTNVSLI
ncbi:MAG: hypothetical protein J0H68_09125 [Sphingobacteriia bacterium]|nr:hypothetical protein [Sphingobacteriia bacterium]